MCIKSENILFKLDKVRFVYKKSSKRAIDELSITIEKGHFWGIIGPNGSGKTTLLDLLAGVKKASSGRIFFNGKDISEYTKKELAKAISFVPQQFYIGIPFQVKDILLMGRHPFIGRFSNPSSHDLYLVKMITELLRLSDLSDRYITELSGGETQRVILARAFVQDTPVILLDEPTSNMDISHSLEILNIIQDQVKKKGKTAIMAIHDINLAGMYCNKLIIIKDGRLICYGDTSEILDKKIIKDVFDVECKIVEDKCTGGRYVLFKKKPAHSISYPC